MNKSDIMKAAELAKRTTSSYKNDEDFARTWEAEIALIAAAELLKQEAVRELNFLRYLDKKIEREADGIERGNTNCTELYTLQSVKAHYLKGKPVIIEKEGV